MRGKTPLILGTALAALLALVACGDGKERPEATPSTTTSATATRAATATATIPPTQASGRSGIAELDPVIDALLSKDAKTIRPLIVFTSVPCTTAVGLGGPPKCPQGQTDGFPVAVFLTTDGCEGGYRAAGEEDSIARGLAQSPLYAVYRVPAGFGYPGQSYASLGFPTQYVAVSGVNGASEVLIADGRIIGQLFSCPPLSPEELVEQRGLTDAVLPPPAQ